MSERHHSGKKAGFLPLADIKNLWLGTYFFSASGGETRLFPLSETHHSEKKSRVSFPCEYRKAATNMPPLQGLAGGPQICCYKYAALTGLDRPSPKSVIIRIFLSNPAGQPVIPAFAGMTDFPNQSDQKT
ncbi:Uncharacterized protein dnm_030760 [Desulfonema magnum]|uniref:Uncharacterized protein n=1 Tax=Desulfonema magnum TaxID=45655 RepID=A0A975BJX7_9BACT|nr:Uncharacterized protein dnm_030760 [Desulfonema magnum]